MAGRVAVTYHPLYDGRGFSPIARSWSRYRLAMSRMASLGILDAVDVERPPLASSVDLLRSHSDAHLDAVRLGDAVGYGTFATSDTPAWRGIFDRARCAVGGTVHAARLVASGKVIHAFNPGGGLHHAMRDQARGFCPFNDLAIVTDVLRTLGVPRVAIVDIDAHHGDGTQELLYDREVLKISLHQHDGRYFPGTGSITEVGWGNGYGLSVNVPMPRHVGEAAYLDAFRAVVPPAIRGFGPDIVILNFGVDGHYADRLSRLGLGINAYRALAAACHALSHETCRGRLIVTGSGGYNPDIVSSCWSVLVATLTGLLPVPDGVAEAMIQRDARPNSDDVVLRPLENSTAWPEPFAALRDTPPLPDPEAVLEVRRVTAAVVDEVLPIRLLGMTSRTDVRPSPSSASYQLT